MKQFLITMAGVFLGLVLFFILVPMVLIGSVASNAGPPAAAQGTVLSLDLREPLSDQPPASAFATFSAGPSVVDIVRKLEAAESDDAVEGLFIRASEMGMAPAHAEEIRQAIIDFRRSGKFVIAHAQGFEMPTLSSYVSVSAADEVWMQAASDFASSGLVSETMFLGGLFERFGITAEFEQFYEFKNAANVYTQRDYTAAHREATNSLLTGVYNAFLAAVATDRKVNVEQIKAVLDTAPLSSSEAQRARLIDKTGRPEDAMDAALERAGGADSASFMDLAQYALREPGGGAPVIALVGGEGAIVTGQAEPDPFSQETQMTGDAIAQAIREATDNDAVKAIVFRVSSPGGSPIASDQIWAAVERAGEKKKPVVVSMGAYAASGGYYVSAGADSIVALPSTITGSIGVLGGKFAINEAANRWTGANFSEVQVGGPYASAFSAQRFTNAQRAEFRAAMERIYADFTGKVAAGRKLPLPAVQEIARGRVWTGAQARQLRLVDQEGGLRVAMARARTLAGIDADTKVRVETYPAAQDPFQALGSFFGAGAETARAAVVLSRLVGDDRLVRILSEATRAGNARIEAREPVTVR